jgi:hypothetical protein
MEIKKITIYPDKKSRIISTTNKWKDNIIETNQYNYIDDVSNISHIVRSEIHKKISGYKSQDTIKKVFCKVNS